MNYRVGFGLYQSCENRRVLDVCLCLGCGGVGFVGEEWVGVWTRVCCCMPFQPSSSLIQVLRV